MNADCTAPLDAWFAARYGSPTPIQRLAWPEVAAGKHVVLMAGTGQGKTLAAWRPVVERLMCASPAPTGVAALHVAPLKSLARDMTLNLGSLIEAASQDSGRQFRIAMRCGDTTRAERLRQLRQPPTVLCTTPESLFVMLASRSGRRMLQHVRTAVLDELHVLAAGKRGAHLSLTLARLEALVGREVQRIGLSATLGDPEALARFVCGPRCRVLRDSGSGPPRVRIELPGPARGTLATNEVRAAVWDRIAELAAASTSMLLFCQTRAEVERSAAALEQRLADQGLPGAVAAHHGSLDRTHRERVEAAFKSGQLRLMVSSASLELGLDIGAVERVAQLGTPGSAALLAQRAGRANHRPGERARIHLFPLTLSQLLEAETLAQCLREGCYEPDEGAEGPSQRAPLDVLAQQLVAMVGDGFGDPQALHAQVTRAWPYRDVEPRVVADLLECIANRPAAMPDSQFGDLLEQDPATGAWAVRPDRRHLIALNAGVIPEFFEWTVLRADTGEQVGRLDEEYAFESSAGAVIQLGHHAWRVIRSACGEVHVLPEPDHEADVPFWIGEGGGRSRLVAARIRQRLADNRHSPAVAGMLDRARSVLGVLPGPDSIVVERFRDPGGDRHLAIHNFAGLRVNRAWGLALRKRFCRQFNFELQACATDDGLLLSLGVNSDFEATEPLRFLNSRTVTDVLVQAVLDQPVFVTRFRWCVANALCVLRHGPDGPVPAQRQRNAVENLIACVFPDQLACLENLDGPRQVPDHPLVHQALNDCLYGYMDCTGLVRWLERVESGELRVVGVDHDRPSPLAEALIHAPRHSFLDPAPAEERRTRAFESARGSRGVAAAPAGPTRVEGLVSAAARVVMPRLDAGLRATPDTLEAWLQQAGFLFDFEGERGLGLSPPVPVGGWSQVFATLVRERRALAVRLPSMPHWLWVVPSVARLLARHFPGLEMRPAVDPELLAALAGDDELTMEALLAARHRELADRGPGIRWPEPLSGVV